MSPDLRARLRRLAWRAATVLHGWDYARVLPLLARLPLPLAYALARWRGRAAAATGRDWRSMALGFRHIHRRTLDGLRLLAPEASEAQLRAWRSGRYETEAREEFEAALISAGRLPELSCEFSPPDAGQRCARHPRGLVLITGHFNSMFLAIAFLARSGARINLLTSAITHDPRVQPAVRAHFTRRARDTESHLNGGRLLDFEDGLRPFYAMLQRGETVVVVADGPAPEGAAALEADFLGRRQVAAGAVRMARRTGSDFGAFVCHWLGERRYRVEMGPVGPSADAQVVDACYRFLSDAIRRQPEHWWAADLLPAMPPVVPKPPPEPLREAPFEAQYDVVIADAGPLAATEEFAAGMRQLRQRIAAPRWWHACTGGALTPAQLLRYSPAELFLAIPEPALVASDNLVAELDAVCRQHAADCVLPADPRCSDGLAIDYVTRQAFDRYVARRAALAAAAPYDGRSPWLYLVRRAAVQAAVDADPAVSWAALPAAAPVRSVTANRAFVHWYGDYQRHDRAEVLDLLPGQVAELLDVGGGEGRFAAAFVERTGGRAAVAELNPAAAAVAAARGLEVHAGPFEGYARRLSFDCVCFLDVLEHLPDPLAALRKARALLKPGGYVLLVVPNVGHWSVVGELLGGDFTYLPAGILCATHLRFFTRRSLEALLREAGFEVVRWRDHPGPPPAAFLERLAAGSGADMESLATDSFHVLARKS